MVNQSNQSLDTSVGPHIQRALLCASIDKPIVGLSKNGLVGDWRLWLFNIFRCRILLLLWTVLGQDSQGQKANKDYRKWPWRCLCSTYKSRLWRVEADWGWIRNGLLMRSYKWTHTSCWRNVYAIYLIIAIRRGIHAEIWECRFFYFPCIFRAQRIPLPRLSNLRVHDVLLSLCCFAVLQTTFVFFHVAEVRWNIVF